LNTTDLEQHVSVLLTVVIRDISLTFIFKILSCICRGRCQCLDFFSGFHTGGHAGCYVFGISKWCNKSVMHGQSRLNI